MKPLLKKSLIAAGIIAGKPLSGPMEISVDITNRCTMGCITCWNYSPLLANPPSQDWKSIQMNLPCFKELIDHVGKKGVSKITIGGNGDPFMHPDILEILKHSKATGAFVSVSTKGAYFQRSTLRSLVTMNLDQLCISILAASTPVFSKMHPTTNPKLFERIVNSIKFLTGERTPQFPRPFVILIVVVCKYNFHEIDASIDLAREVGADMVSFKRVDVFPGTRSLLLNDKEISILREKLTIAQQKSLHYGISTNIDDFRLTSLSGLRNGLYSRNLYRKIPCYIGFTYARVKVDGDIAPCCGCYEWSMGNLNDTSFDNIWKGKQYAEFRKVSGKIFRYGGKISGCGCDSCVHSSGNLAIYKKIHPFNAQKFISEL